MTPELIGYADRWTVAPGERVRFMVSTELPSYEVGIVRLIHGDENPRGPGPRSEVVAAPCDGRYAGRHQQTRAGSYVVVPDHAAFDSPRGLTLAAWIYPTLPSMGRSQTLFARCSPRGESGYGLSIEHNGMLAVWLGDLREPDRVVAVRPLPANRWSLVVATYDGDTGRACLVQHSIFGPLAPARTVVERVTLRAMRCGASRGPLLIAASRRADGSPADFYNGKIDRPCAFGRAINESEVSRLCQGERPVALDSTELIGAWDFGADLATPTVRDLSPNELHGCAINMPTRGVTGFNWTGTALHHGDAPHEYGAIHFHEDDLEDAAWSVDFEFVVPPQLRSGVYAARLRSGDIEDHIPFVVTPEQGKASARIAVLLPTFTYLAYANERIRLRRDLVASGQTDMPPDPNRWDTCLANHPEWGLSLYDTHSDGSGVCYASRLRPVPNLRPDYRNWLTHAPRHLGADLYVGDWLEHGGYAYDVLTDEDLQARGAELLRQYAVVITGSHPEYATAPMLDGLQRYVERGGRLMYLGGNGFYWVTSVDPTRPHLIEVRRGVAGTRPWDSAPGESYHSTTGEPGGQWLHRGRPANRLVGVGFTAQGWDAHAVGYRRAPASYDAEVAFVFEGIGPDEVIGDFGLVMNSAAGDEIDRADLALGTPPETVVLASSAGHSDCYQLALEHVRSMRAGLGGREHADVRADMTLLRTPTGGAVFAVGSIAWSGSLSHNGYANNVARVTDNVLRRFLT